MFIGAWSGKFEGHLNPAPLSPRNRIASRRRAAQTSESAVSPFLRSSLLRRVDRVGDLRYAALRFPVFPLPRI